MMCVKFLHSLANHVRNSPCPPFSSPSPFSEGLNLNSTPFFPTLEG